MRKRIITMTVVSNVFGALLPLDFGTNTILVMASDISGNASTNAFTLVNTYDYQLGITSPAAFGTYANGEAQTVSGFVSQYWDSGFAHANERGERNCQRLWNNSWKFT